MEQDRHDHGSVTGPTYSTTVTLGETGWPSLRLATGPGNDSTDSPCHSANYASRPAPGVSSFG
jgi:hypothetical protein